MKQQLSTDESVSSSRPVKINAEQLKAIGSGKFRRKSGQKKELEEIKMKFDVVYQPQVNELFSSNNGNNGQGNCNYPMRPHDMMLQSPVNGDSQSESSIKFQNSSNTAMISMTQPTNKAGGKECKSGRRRLLFIDDEETTSFQPGGN